MDIEEIKQFNGRGRQAITRLVAAAHDLLIWAEAYEQRGGQLVFGDDAAQIAAISTALQSFITPSRKAILSKFRSDV